MEATEINYKSIDPSLLTNLGQKGFRTILKTGGYDKLRFLMGALDKSEDREVVRKRFSPRCTLKVVPLTALSLWNAFFSVEAERFNSFLARIVSRQISNLQVLEVHETHDLDLKVCRKINKWMKSNQVVGFSLTQSSTTPENLGAIFQVKPEHKDIRVKELKLGNVEVPAGCLLQLVHLTNLKLEGNILGELVWEELCLLIRDTNTLKVLITSEIVQTEGRAKVLGNAISQNKTIKTLDFRNEEEAVFVPFLQVIFQSESLTRFKFRPLEYTCNLVPLYSALREGISSGQANLISLELARITIPNDILAMLNVNMKESNSSLDNEK